MEQVKYKNFDILIQNRDGEQYPTRVLQSPAGETRGVLSFSSLVPDVISNLKSLRDLVLEIRTDEGSNVERWTQAERFGELLFDALMSGEVRSCFDVSLNLRGKDGLRIRLRIEPPELTALPWELMHDKRSNSFISLSIYTPIVRYIELQQAAAPLAIRKPLRILVVISSPTDQAPLNVEAETRQLTLALSDLVNKGDVEITTLKGANLLAIQKQLREEEYHVLHYIGHGHFGESDGEGYLLFENNQGRSHPVSGRKLGPLLHDEETLRLVVLNACSTGVSAEGKPFSGVATSLVQAGIPAVVAMQTSVTDDAALQFSQVFYESIADGCPIDTSVAEGRKAIEFSASHTVEWAIPELFMRVADGLLFSFDSQTREAVNEQSGNQTAREARAIPAPVAEVVKKAPSGAGDSRVANLPIEIAGRIIEKRSPASNNAQVDARLVTNEEFMRFVETTGAKAPSSWQHGRYPRERAGQPATGVSWRQAAAYAQWIGRRLPSAAEWDHALATLQRTNNLWEWTSDEVTPRGLGRKEKKRALKGGPPNSTSDRDSITSAWPDDELEYIGFRCATTIKETS